MDYRKVYEEWCAYQGLDEETKAELREIAGNDNEIRERFGRELAFGTAGLRGILGAGTNRMNRHIVRKTTQGLANYIMKTGETKRGVAISYDSRRMSPEFALEAALVLAANGIPAYLFESLRPTPELSFAVRHYHCIAGLNITASHNPAEYNGYKVYWEDGAQITPPHDAGITEEVHAMKGFEGIRTMDEEEAKKAGLLIIIGEETDAAYLAEVKKSILHQEAIDKEGANITVVYTPLHGTGNIPVRRVLREIGFSKVYVVPEQEKPDGNFPTVSYPNPEADAAFALGLALAKEKDADLVLATDPDADRLGVRVRDNDGVYHNLTGNMSGTLLAYYELSQRKALGLLPEDGAVVKSIVTTNLVDPIAKDFGAELFEVLTGFKYIGQKMLEMEKSGKGTYLFGFEESYGCLIGTYARDKDAVAASMALCEAAAYYKTEGRTLWDVMVEIYEKYGYVRDGVTSIEMKGLDGLAKIRAVMEDLRKNVPETLGGEKVLRVRDYEAGTILDTATKETCPTGLPKSDVLYYELGGDAWVCVRPSGTEPKVKFYYGVSGRDEADASAREENMKASIRALAANA